MTTEDAAPMEVVSPVPGAAATSPSRTSPNKTTFADAAENGARSPSRSPRPAAGASPEPQAKRSFTAAFGGSGRPDKTAPRLSSPPRVSPGRPSTRASPGPTVATAPASLFIAQPTSCTFWIPPHALSEKSLVAHPELYAPTLSPHPAQHALHRCFLCGGPTHHNQSACVIRGQEDAAVKFLELLRRFRDHTLKGLKLRSKKLRDDCAKEVQLRIVFFETALAELGVDAGKSGPGAWDKVAADADVVDVETPPTAAGVMRGKVASRSISVSPDRKSGADRDVSPRRSPSAPKPQRGHSPTGDIPHANSSATDRHRRTVSRSPSAADPAFPSSRRSVSPAATAAAGTGEFVPAGVSAASPPRRSVSPGEPPRRSVSPSEPPHRSPSGPPQRSASPGSPPRRPVSPGEPPHRSPSPREPSQRSASPGEPPRRSVSPSEPPRRSASPGEPPRRSVSPSEPPRRSASSAGSASRFLAVPGEEGDPMDVDAGSAGRRSPSPAKSGGSARGFLEVPGSTAQRPVSPSPRSRSWTRDTDRATAGPQAVRALSDTGVPVSPTPLTRGRPPVEMYVIEPDGPMVGVRDEADEDAEEFLDVVGNSPVASPAQPNKRQKTESPTRSLKPTAEGDILLTEHAGIDPGDIGLDEPGVLASGQKDAGLEGRMRHMFGGHDPMLTEDAVRAAAEDADDLKVRSWLDKLATQTQFADPETTSQMASAVTPLRRFFEEV
ncbi:hypothetical protein HDU96_004937 [Phlyctochytrium bullatum]|nr:hypothetical protein HDU96_004937 [Phlyctochytrium bullatum]